ncbi:hypothetical protein NC651_037367 [Populus alba x Populus x berolinensis]|nr:hypothetical protein NC651_037367 [Populus alba x Populus x berolinensis]
MDNIIVSSPYCKILFKKTRMECSIPSIKKTLVPFLLFFVFFFYIDKESKLPTSCLGC